jgi:hypothetical protein
MLYKYSSFRMYVYFIIVFLNCLFVKCQQYTIEGSLNESDLSFNTGLGIKWKIADKFYLKPLYRITSSKIQGTTDKMLYHGFSIRLGYIYTPKMFRNN